MPAISDYLTDAEILQILGFRLRKRRLSRNMLVDDEAVRAGVNRKTVLGIEGGEDIRVSSLIKILRGLDMLGALEAAFPDTLPGGEGISSRGQPRMKASSQARRKKTGIGGR